jgi:UDP-3-O-acyl N-acetylglucosamine deacetylase
VSRVETVEHLLAAISALEVCDLDIAVEGPEIPILDGSFAPFVDALLEAGLRGGGSPPAIDLEAPVDWTDGDAVYRAEPGDRLEIEVELVYREPVIGRQSAGGAVTADWFVREIAPARTFGFLEEVEPLQRRGLLAGARSDSAIVLAADRPLNTSLRWPNEFARHKLGDLLGDVALIGLRPRARIFASRPSHRGNIAFARALAAACGHPTED